MPVLPQPYLLIAKTTAVVAVIGGLWLANQHYVVNPAVDRANSEWRQKWDARDKADAQSALQQEKENRDKEKSLQAVADAEQQKADAARAYLSRQLAASRVAAQQLQSGVEQAIHQLGGTASATAGRPTTARAGLLLAELYRSIDERSGYLAAEADRRREAGLTCQRLYDNARQEKAR